MSMTAYLSCAVGTCFLTKLNNDFFTNSSFSFILPPETPLKYKYLPIT